MIHVSNIIMQYDMKTPYFLAVPLEAVAGSQQRCGVRFRPGITA